MLSLVTVAEAKEQIAEGVRKQRLQRKLTQEGVALRAGVKLATYRRFEQTGKISLESYLKILNVLGLLGQAVSVTSQQKNDFQTLDQVLKAQEATRLPKRGSKR